MRKCCFVIVIYLIGSIHANANTPTPTYCEAINIQSAAINAETPATLDAIKNSPQWKMASGAESIWHNLREGLVTETFDQRLQIAVMSLYEYWKKTRSEWRYLDPKWPNVKYVETNGHREVVYNIQTGKKVDKGINQATANYGRGSLDPAHWGFDIPNWVMCGTPDERQNAIGKLLVNIPEVRNASDEVIKIISDAFHLDPGGLQRKILDGIATSIDATSKKDSNLPVRRNNYLDLRSLNLDDPNGDWCKCDPPECKDETNGLIRYIQCQCAKCGKINVECARRALAMEKEVKAQGGQAQWLGNRSDAVKAANTQK